MRASEEVQQSFDRFASVLDAGLASVRPWLVAENIDVWDRSNRVQGKSGFPYFFWSFRFDRKYEHGSEIALASAHLDYSEPMDDAASRHLLAESIAEIYQTGQQSRFQDVAQYRLPLEALEPAGVSELIRQLIEDAATRLARQNVATHVPRAG